MIIFTAEKSLKEYGEKVPVETRKLIEDKIADVKTAKNGSEIETIKKAIEGLTTELSKIGEIMNKANAETAKNPTPEQQNDEVKDAEVKEDNK
jgi:molecular chaperone DnaK